MIRFFSVLWLFILLSCDHNVRCKTFHSLIEFEVIQSVNVKLSGSQYYHVTPNIFETDTAVMLFGLDPYAGKVDVYNLTSEEFLYSILLQKEGPHEVISPHALYIHNPDSIYLMNDVNQLYLINQKGERLNIWNFDFNLPDSVLALDQAITGAYIIAAYGKSEYLNLPFIYEKKDNAVIARLLILNHHQGSEEYTLLYRTPNLIKIDLQTGQPVGFYGKYPAHFLKEPKPHNPFAHFVKVVDNTWVQFDSSDEIYWVEQDTFFCSRSLYANSQVTVFSSEEVIDEEKELRAYHTDDAYVGIYYDPYRNLVYRVFQVGQPDKNPDGTLNHKLQAPFTVMILKPTGETIGEAVFEGSKYNFLDFFVTSQGVLISKENSFNTENEEELYSFDLIRFKL